MFMNAQPRRVAHGYETFVYGRSTEALHQRLSEMTENQVNAWCSIKPAESSVLSRDDSWNNQKGAAIQDENYYQITASQNSCAQSLQNDFCYGRAASFGRGTTSYSYATPSTRQNCSASLYRQPVSASLYQRDTMQANTMVKPEAMLSNTSNYQLPWTSMVNTGSSYFAEDHELLQMFPYHTLSDSVPQSSCGLPGASSLRSRMPFGSQNPFDLSSTASSSLYGGYSASGAMADGSFPRVQSFRAATNTHQPMVWNGTPDASQGYIGMDGLDTGGLADQHHGLPGLSPDDSWFLDPLSASDWSQQSYEPSTISPKDLNLDASTSVVPVKCPEMFDNPIRKGAAVDVNAKLLVQDLADPPHPFKQQVRKQLPAGKPKSSLPDVPIIPSTTIKKVTKNRAKSPRTISPILKPKLSSRQPPSRNVSPKRQSMTAPQKTPPKPQAIAPLLDPIPSDSLSVVSPPPTAAAPRPPINIQPSSEMPPGLLPRLNALRHQESKDRFLVRSKQAGMSYKDIRQAGNFTEAESTLRGRFRTLTKKKEERVRKPEWESDDIRLMKRAVRKLTRDQGHEQSKVPWKKVAEYIAKNGGSYHFGNATCRKKWDELQLSAAEN